MAETRYDLDLQLSAVVAANGTALITVGPDSPLERWEFASTQVTNSGQKICQCRVFDTPALSVPKEGTYSGKLDQSNTGFRLFPNMKLYYQWSNATPGSLCTLNVRGTRYVKGDRGGGL